MLLVSLLMNVAPSRQPNTFLSMPMPQNSWTNLPPPKFWKLVSRLSIFSPHTLVVVRLVSSVALASEKLYLFKSLLYFACHDDLVNCRTTSLKHMVVTQYSRVLVNELEKETIY